MKVVIDTNVFISSFFGGNPRKIIDCWRKELITLCVSKDILDEYFEVLRRMGLSNTRELEELLLLFGEGFNLLFTAKTPELRLVKDDPDDDKFIECAVALSAEYIITGDKTLRALRNYMNVRIVIPQELLRSYQPR